LRRISPPKSTGGRSSLPQLRQVSAISDEIGSPQPGQAVITSPPQSGHTSGTDPALPIMKRRPQPQVRQKPQQSPSSLLRS